ncbi:Flap endonuclease, partial [Thalictrum thalictroides]
APSEAEAECAALCKSGKVYAVASEDMDSLTFGAPKFLRHLMDPSSRKIPTPSWVCYVWLPLIELFVYGSGHTNQTNRARSRSKEEETISWTQLVKNVVFQTRGVEGEWRRLGFG